MPPTPELHVFVHEEQIFTSFNVSSLPAMVPPIPRPWNPYLESNSSPDNIKDAFTMHDHIAAGLVSQLIYTCLKS
ncbi:hypothetical protein BDR04DRAFT_1149956 [Suillus decipiens]|nr:hypothetical protein BDR04DRAFT_1149956 [Suillus decipiens]